MQYFIGQIFGKSIVYVSLKAGQWTVETFSLLVLQLCLDVTGFHVTISLTKPFECRGCNIRGENT